MAAGFRAVLFDLDGVLVHSKPVWHALLRRLCRDLGYVEPDEERFEAAWGQGVQADVETLFTRHTVEELSALYARHFIEHGEALVVDPDGPPLFSALRARGLPIAVVTNTPRPLADQLVALAGLSPDTIVGGTDTERAKPAPDPLLEACRRLEVRPQRTLMVGDTSVDRDAAAAAEVPFVGFGGVAGRWSLQTLPDLLGLIDEGSS